MEAVQRRYLALKIKNASQRIGVKLCGIVGIIGGKIPEGHWGDAYALIRNLLLECEHRGKDATGFVARTAPLDSPTAAITLVAKRPLSASEFVETTEFTRLAHRRCSSFIGHCRAAMHGNPNDNRNNHPHVGERLVLVHNGVCENVHELQDKYLLDLETDCDSEAILRLIETQDDPASGLMLAMREVKGSMTVAIYDMDEDCVWLASNGGRPLWIAHSPRLRSWVFASTGEIILRAMRETFGKRCGVLLDVLMPVPDYMALALTPSGLVFSPRTV